MEVLKEILKGVIKGHLDEQKMTNQLKERFYWPGMSDDVKHWCQTCVNCATRKFYHRSNASFCITKKNGYADYHFKEVYRRKPVIHFNQLKHCKPGTGSPYIAPGESDDRSQKLDISGH